MCGVMGARVGLEAVLGPRDTCGDKPGASGPVSNGVRGFVGLCGGEHWGLRGGAGGRGSWRQLWGLGGGRGAAIGCGDVWGCGVPWEGGVGEVGIAIGLQWGQALWVPTGGGSQTLQPIARPAPAPQRCQPACSPLSSSPPSTSPSSHCNPCRVSIGCPPPPPTLHSPHIGWVWALTALPHRPEPRGQPFSHPGPPPALHRAEQPGGAAPHPAAAPGRPHTAPLARPVLQLPDHH